MTRIKAQNLAGILAAVLVVTMNPSDPGQWLAALIYGALAWLFVGGLRLADGFSRPYDTPPSTIAIPESPTGARLVAASRRRESLDFPHYGEDVKNMVDHHRMPLYRGVWAVTRGHQGGG